jgi:hypothetical protein
MSSTTLRTSPLSVISSSSIVRTVVALHVHHTHLAGCSHSLTSRLLSTITKSSEHVSLAFVAPAVLVVYEQTIELGVTSFLPFLRQFQSSVHPRQTNMDLTIFLLSFFYLVANCCMPPFNDFRYLDNATLLQEAIAKHQSNPKLGWVHVVGSESPVKPWPKSQYGRTVIPFCYGDQLTRDRLDSMRYEAWSRWYHAIRTAGPGTGHHLAGFQETEDSGGNSIYCFTDSENTLWNPRLPADALIIDITVDSYDTYAILGYQPREW